MSIEYGWKPEGWNDYIDRYPNTPELPEASSAGTRDFQTIWERVGPHNNGASSVASLAGNQLFVLVRGIFGNLMPGNFAPVLRDFRNAGMRVVRPHGYVVGTIESSAERLHKVLRPLLPEVTSIVWLCQSRGGLDALWAIGHNEALRARTAGVILVQTPVAASAIMESVMADRHASTLRGLSVRATEKLQKAVFSLPALRPGCEQLMSPQIDERVRHLQRISFEFPLISVATWSLKPTSWVDSYHRRLGQIRPGCAHDGLFYLEDQLWPTAEQLVLGRIDHAQSVMGGMGFDLVRFWTTLVAMLIGRAHA